MPRTWLIESLSVWWHFFGSHRLFESWDLTELSHLSVMSSWCRREFFQIDSAKRWLTLTMSYLTFSLSVSITRKAARYNCAYFWRQQLLFSTEIFSSSVAWVLLPTIPEASMVIKQNHRGWFPKYESRRWYAGAALAWRMEAFTFSGYTRWSSQISKW